MNIVKPKWMGEQTVEFEGMLLTLETESQGEKVTLSKGDLYLAERNQGPRLLTCEKVFAGSGQGWVQPKEPAYCYNLYECFKVVSMDEVL